MSYPTSTFDSRTARQSGTEYASAIEITRRRDTSGWMIVAGVCFVIALALVLS